MENPPPPNSLSFDTNLLLDLGFEKDYALTFLEILTERDAVRYVTPTALKELGWKAIYGEPDEKQAAIFALQNLGPWGIVGLEPERIEADLVLITTDRILEAALLPATERNDARIIAETSIAAVPHLVSNDQWVNGIDQPALNHLLKAAHLNPITVVDPRRFLRGLRDR